MNNKAFKIEERDYFKAYADKRVFGLLPKEILENKLMDLGYFEDSEGIPVPEDAYYLCPSDLDKLMRKKGRFEYLAVDNPAALYNAFEQIKTQINMEHIENGVQLYSLTESYIDYTVNIAPGAVIYPGTYLEGQCYINESCVIGPETRIVSSRIAEGTSISKSNVVKSSIGKNCIIGPYSNIRPDTVIKDHVRIGAFVEVKNSTVGEDTKISHLAYAGDSEIGRSSNLACGVVTANYDGKNKHKTIIGDNVFIGCNSTMVAPVELKDNTFVAAGSVIVEDVQSGDLAIARSRQTNKEGWVKRTGRYKE